MKAIKEIIEECPQDKNGAYDVSSLNLLSLLEERGLKCCTKSRQLDIGEGAESEEELK